MVSMRPIGLRHHFFLRGFLGFLCSQRDEGGETNGEESCRSVKLQGLELDPKEQRVAELQPAEEGKRTREGDPWDLVLGPCWCLLQHV